MNLKEEPMVHRISVLLLAAVVAGGCEQQPSSTPVTDLDREKVVQEPSGQLAGAKTEALKPVSNKVVLGAAELLAGIPGDGPLAVEDIRRWLDNPANKSPLEIDLPFWMGEPAAGQIKDLNEKPMTRAKIELGRQLFFDKRLSIDDTVSCASCHEPEHGYTVATSVGTGINGQKGRRNPPALLNRVMLALGNDQQFWDGRSTSVEDALLHSLEDVTEMAAAPEATIEKLKGIEGYRLQFEQSYGDVTWENLGDAIGCFVRCLVTGPSPFDYFERWEPYKDYDQELLDEEPELAIEHRDARLAAEAHPMSESAKRGEYLFFGNKAWCSACHQSANFTDELYHNTGIGLDAEKPDLGRYLVTKKEPDWGAFKTPTIRGAIHTAPYMHDGSVATLEDVIDWYDHQGRANRNLDYRYKRIAREELTEQDKKDLVEFVKACSGPLPEVESGRLPE
jgi:cytochrome c peroxidase